jgi:hypothetical protein
MGEDHPYHDVVQTAWVICGSPHHFNCTHSKSDVSWFKRQMHIRTCFGEDHPYRIFPQGICKGNNGCVTIAGTIIEESIAPSMCLNNREGK